MMIDSKESIQVKVFLGFQLPLDLKISLNQNHEWKTASFDHSNEKLEIVRDEGKEYIGRHLNGKMFTMSILRDEEKKIKEQLALYFPEYPLERLTSALFPHIFVA